MNITKSWLRKHDACEEGCAWFERNFPEGGGRDEVLSKLERADLLEDYGWLLWQTLRQCPLPEGWVLPEGLETLCLEGGTLPTGTVLPGGLRLLDLDGGTLPDGTALPAGLKWLHLEGGALPDGTVLPGSLIGLYLEGGTLPEGLEIPSGCRVYE
jgi:hypothetical protein